MTTPLEFNGHPAFNIGGLVFLGRTDGGIAKMVPKGETLTICAWCDPDKILTRKLDSYTVSHGICESCTAKFLVGTHSPPLNDPQEAAT